MTTEQATKIFRDDLGIRNGESPHDVKNTAYALNEVHNIVWLQNPPQEWDDHIMNTLYKIEEMTYRDANRHLILMKGVGLAGQHPDRTYFPNTSQARGDRRTLPKVSIAKDGPSLIASTPLASMTVTTMWNWLFEQIDTF